MCQGPGLPPVAAMTGGQRIAAVIVLWTFCLDSASWRQPTRCGQLLRLEVDVKEDEISAALTSEITGLRGFSRGGGGLML